MTSQTMFKEKEVKRAVKMTYDMLMAVKHNVILLFPHIFHQNHHAT